MINIYYQPYDSPIARLHIYADDSEILAIAFDDNREKLVNKYSLRGAIPLASPIIEKARSQLGEYFNGLRKTFELPLQTRGTIFQVEAWQMLQKIPYGERISYTDQALAMGKMGAYRAIGSANGKNPYPIVIPCHRVVGKSGKLVGYVGGESVKAALLSLESQNS